MCLTRRDHSQRDLGSNGSGRFGQSPADLLARVIGDNDQIFTFLNPKACLDDHVGAFSHASVC
jgi:hypothetical protein